MVTPFSLDMSIRELRSGDLNRSIIDVHDWHLLLQYGIELEM